MKKRIISMLLCVLILPALVFPAFAFDLEDDFVARPGDDWECDFISAEDVVFYIGSETTPEEEKAILEEFLNIPDATLVVLFDEFQVPDDEVYDGSCMYARQPHWQYRVVRGTTAAARADTSRRIGDAWNGQPGMTHTMSRTNTISNSITASFGASIQMISLSLGFNVTQSNSLSDSTRMTVPSTHNGRRVIDMTMQAHPFIQTTTYRTYRRPDPRVAWELRGTGTATRQIGVAFRNTFRLA